MRRLVKLFAGFGTAILFFVTNAAYAQESDSVLANFAKPWEMGFQPAASPIADQAHAFWHLLFWIIVAISILVLLLLGTVIIKFRAKANPVPSKVTHNTLIEVIWTIAPVIILLVIFVPSMRLLFAEDKVADADITIKATGNQWFWEYEYPDEGFSFVSNIVPDDQLKPGQPRLLTVDEHVVVPVGAVVRVLTTSNDVIHSWAVPAFYVKMDAVPGRLNETWFKAEREGKYFGQCSELCGIRHGFMPIEVEVVSRSDYNTWLTKMKQEYGSLEPSGDVRVAQAQIEAH